MWDQKKWSHSKRGRKARRISDIKYVNSEKGRIVRLKAEKKYKLKIKKALKFARKEGVI